ncbi:poly(A)-specific ribonuclease PARN-like [Chironomus tepperi]|uniref:poly(A)-specific ribonuclease PARN-like n=1 Tax=Chironomus tepperi TaxID=113505 RepID=UPI00391F886E
MEVVKSNFKDLLPEITKDIEESCFISIDCEFTGICSERNIMPFDSSREYYEKQLKTSKGFIIVQLGLTMFKKDPEDDLPKLKSYNIYAFPSQRTATFTCQAESLTFLGNKGFDFTKLFTNGVSYCTSAEEEKLRQNMKERQEQRMEQLKKRISPEEQDFSSKMYINVPENEKFFIIEAREQIQRVVDKKLLEASFEKVSAFQRKLLYELIEQDFYNKVSTSTRNLENNKKALIVIIKRTSEDEMRLENDRIRDDERNLIDAIGLRLIMKEISASKKLIIGHNCLLDIMYITNQCFQELPEDYDSFKKLIHEIFPNIMDTKFMANSEKFKDIFSSSVLNDVYERLLKKPFNKVDVKWEDEYNTYSLETPKEHEAGYDSFLTGYCFLILLNHLKVPLAPKFEKSKELSIFLNRIALQRILNPYIYLTGNEPVPNRAHVFFIKFPHTWMGSDIHDHFKNYGPIQIAWVDNATAFISLINKENSSCVIKTIGKVPGFEIKSFADYQNETERMQKKRKKDETSDQESNSRADSQPKQKHVETQIDIFESNNWTKSHYHPLIYMALILLLFICMQLFINP